MYTDKYLARRVTCAELLCRLYARRPVETWKMRIVPSPHPAASRLSFSTFMSIMPGKMSVEEFHQITGGYHVCTLYAEPKG